MKSKREILNSIVNLNAGIRLGVGGEAFKTTVKTLLWVVDYKTDRPDWMSEEEWENLTAPEEEEEVSDWERM